MTNNQNPDAIDMTATNARRLAELRATPAPIMPDRPTRKLPPRSRRHSVRHRAIR